MKRDKEKGTILTLVPAGADSDLARDAANCGEGRPEASGGGMPSGKHKTRAGFFGWKHRSAKSR